MFVEPLKDFFISREDFVGDFELNLPSCTNDALLVHNRAFSLLKETGVLSRSEEKRYSEGLEYLECGVIIDKILYSGGDESPEDLAAQAIEMHHFSKRNIKHISDALKVLRDEDYGRIKDDMSGSFVRFILANRDNFPGDGFRVIKSVVEDLQESFDFLDKVGILTPEEMEKLHDALRYVM
jgi:hypothetical protein